MTSIPQIAAAATAQSQAAIQTQVSTAVAAKQLDAQRASGDAANQLLESAAQLSKQLGLGHQLDAQG